MRGNHSFGLAGRTRRVNNIRKITRRNSQVQILRSSRAIEVIDIQYARIFRFQLTRQTQMLFAREQQSRLRLLQYVAET